MLNLEKVQNCANAIKNAVPAGFAPELALVLGTGLGALAAHVEKPVHIPYSALPDYPASTVPSHEGRFVCGFLAGLPVIMQQGRCHLYEGYSPEEVCLGVRAMALSGASALFITNSAGSINPLFKSGSLMLIDDHINFTGQSPLCGVDDKPPLGTRFIDMSAVYDQTLGEIAAREALALGVTLEKGVYAGILGPQFETKAETRFLRHSGADAVGMSTVMEVIAARHFGMRVIGISCLTNQNLPDRPAENTLEEVMETAEKASDSLFRLTMAFTLSYKNIMKKKYYQ